MKQTRRYVERDGKIYARISYTDSTGKRRQIWRRAQSKSDAKDISTNLSRQLDESGSESFEHELILGQYLDRWLETARQKVSERSYGSYESLLSLYIRPALGKKRLAKLRPLDIQEVVNEMKQRGLSGRTVRYAHTVFSSALKQAVRWRLMTSNPAQFVELPKRIRNEMRALSPEQAKLFLANAAKDRHGLIFEVAVITGMRPEEYLALQWADLDLKQGTATVKRTLVQRPKGGGWYFGEPKTSQSRRTIPLPHYVVRKLMKHRGEQAEERLKLGDEYHNNGLVFATHTGTPLSIRNLKRRHFKPILRKAELPEIRLYDLRHTCATLLLVAGENPKVVSERLGHASIVLTLDTYSHVLPSMQKSATEKLVGMLR